MNYVYPISFIGYFCVLIATLCYDHLKKLSKETILVLGALEGLKKFIKTAEISRLQMLVDDNPQYFYNMLPYAYIFNLSNKWIKKFENMVKLDNTWSSGIGFREKDFNHFMKTMNCLTEPSYENGGIIYSSSGGSSHHSSGGGGGGGVRSW